jgi:hypothetical protein
VPISVLGWTVTGLVLLGVIAWEWGLLLVTSHRPGDFTVFYAIGHYLDRAPTSLFSHAYDYRVQVTAEQLYGLVARNGSLAIPMVNPPTAVLLFLAIARLTTLSPAYVIWDVVTFAGFAGALLWIAGTWRLLTPRGVIVLACLASFPALIDLTEGDVDLVVAIGMVLIIQAQRRSWRAGGPLGAILISMKPQTLLLWIVPALQSLRLRVARDVLGTLIVLVVASAVIFGPIGVRQMITRVVSVPEKAQEHVTLLGLFDSFLGKGPIGVELAVAVGVALSVGLWFMWSRFPPESELEVAYAAAAVTAASLAAAPYDLLQGLVVLAVPAVLVAAARWCREFSLLPVLVAVVAVSTCALAGFARYLPLPATSVCLLVLAVASAMAWRRQCLAGRLVAVPDRRSK